MSTGNVVGGVVGAVVGYVASGFNPYGAYISASLPASCGNLIDPADDHKDSKFPDFENDPMEIKL